MNTLPFWRAGAVVCLSLSILAAGAAACSAPEPASASEDDEVNGDGLTVHFETAYTAFDGVHDYRIPAKVDGVKKPKWSASPEDLVDLEPQSDGSVMITSRGAGTVTITAKSGGLSGSAKLTITAAKTDEWQAGSDRYNNGIVFTRGDRDGGSGDGGGGGGGGNRKPNPELACTNCHAKGKSDIEHTPMQTGGFSDQELVTIFTQGKKPQGGEQRIMPLEQWQKMHQWKMEPEEQRGLVWYLRSLEPKSQGPTDFGGRGQGKGRDGGREGGRSEDASGSGAQ